MDASTIAECTGASMANALVYEEPLTTAMERFDINTPRRQAAFLATVAVESQNLSKVEEGLYYKDAARLAKIYPRAFANAQEAEPYARNPKALGQKLYQGYWGRGLIQLTWQRNYAAAGKALGFAYLDSPEMLTEPQHAALTAAWFFATNGCNEKADLGQMREVTRIVNGPALMHLQERLGYYQKALEVLS